MPLKTNVGVSRKVSDNNYGSCGASVNLEVELDSALINEPDRFHERIRQVFRLAQQAIDEELTRQHSSGTASHVTNGNNGHAAQPTNNGNGTGHATNGNGQHANGNGNGHATNGNGKSVASEKQMTFARQLAGQIKGLGVRKLESLAAKMFNKPLASLSTMDASGLIDMLKSIKDGTVSVETALEGSPS
jgi:hypothetical protein